MEFVGAQITRKSFGVGQPDLADEHTRLRIAVGDRAPASVDVVQLVAIGERVLTGGGVRQLLRELGILLQQSRRVDAHAGDAAVEPEAQNVLVLLPDLRVLPIEIGLLRGKQVEVPLAVGDARPGRAAEDRLPLVRWQLALGALAGPKPEALTSRRTQAAQPAPP